MRTVLLFITFCLGLPAFAQEKNSGLQQEDPYGTTTTTMDTVETKATITTPPNAEQGTPGQTIETKETKQTIKTKAETPEDKEYKLQMIRLSNAIAAKALQIQAAQRRYESEVYPSYKPPIFAEIIKLRMDMRNLELERTRLQAEQTAKEMAKQLANPAPPKPPSTSTTNTSQ